LWKFIQEEMSKYHLSKDNQDEFKPNCKEFIQESLNHEVSQQELKIETSSTSENLEISSNDSNFMAYLLSCIDQFNQIDSSEHKIKETMNDFSKKLDEEIKQFEEKFPPGLGDHILDLFFSYNFFQEECNKDIARKRTRRELS